MPQQREQWRNQLTGNIGLYYTCYRLSQLNWNVLPTCRNAKGVDLVIYDQDGKRRHTIQVKGLSKKDDVPMGSSLEPLQLPDFVVICRNVRNEKNFPESFIMKPNEIEQKIVKNVKGKGNSYWLKPEIYEQFRDKWEKIGNGGPALV